MKKRFTIYVYIELISSILFSLLSLSFNGDISLTAFPVAAIFTAVTVYFTFFKFLKNENGKNWLVSLKLIQYLPFILLLSFVLRRAGDYGTSFTYDLISVILWCITFIFSLVLSSKMSPKRIEVLTQKWKTPAVCKKHPKGLKGLLFEIVDWADALVQAVFMVLLIQIFILQLYVIPSESMVPTFLIKDRVAVSKINCGPKFPLTDIGLPCFTKYNRGDIVVFRNPHYSMDRKSEVKSVTSQLVYMLTFMSVNLNKDENGKIKADPLVKRITGIEGEQLVMQDGVLYARTKDDLEFKPVDKDAEFACWNLSEINPELKSKIEFMPFSNADYKVMLELETRRRQFDLNNAKIQVEEIVSGLENLLKDKQFNGNFAIPALNQHALYDNCSNIARDIYTKEGGLDWFRKFMTSWIDSADEKRDIYSEANYKMNVMEKIYFGNLVLKFNQFLYDNVSSTEWMNDESVVENKNNYFVTVQYIENLLDERNMPVFPANDSYGNPQFIPKDCYFMMGDNRFNSLDMRHKYTKSSVKLAENDSMSLEYMSMMDPEYVHKKLILGKPMFRFWPANRFGSFN